MRFLTFFILASMLVPALLQAKSIDVDALMRDYNTVQTTPDSLSASRDSVFIFVSFSMPPESLKEWISDATKIGAPVVLRGFIDNSFKQTVSAVKAIVPTYQGGIEIDPKAFEKYHIGQVPAVVIVGRTGEYDVVYGNATLSAALKVFSLKGSQATQTQAQQLLSLLEPRL